MFSHVLFGILALLYYALRWILRSAFGGYRRNRVLYRGARSALDTLQRQYGGTLSAGRHTVGWSLPDGSAVQIRRHSRPGIVIRIPIECDHSLTFQRIPRLFFAFAENFMTDDSRMGATPYFVFGDIDVLEAFRSRPDFMRLFERLSDEAYSVRIGEDGLRAWKRIAAGETDDLRVYEQVRLLRDFARLCSGAVLLPIQSLASAARCAYCHEEALNGDDIVHCAACSTPHHQECFSLNGKCSVFGCESARPMQGVLLAH